MTVSIVSHFRSGCKAPPSSPFQDAKDIPAPEIDPVLKAFGRHIARSFSPGAWCTHPRHEKHDLRAGAPHTRTETRF